jgi:hypothetical protein
MHERVGGNASRRKSRGNRDGRGAEDLHVRFGLAEVFRADGNLIRVHILDRTSEAYLVYLPVTPLEVSSRCVAVSREKVIWL